MRHLEPLRFRRMLCLTLGLGTPHATQTASRLPQHCRCAAGAAAHLQSFGHCMSTSILLRIPLQRLVLVLLTSLTVHAA